MSNRSNGTNKIILLKGERVEWVESHLKSILKIYNLIVGVKNFSILCNSVGVLVAIATGKKHLMDGATIPIRVFLPYLY